MRVEYFEFPTEQEILSDAISVGIYVDPVNRKRYVCLQFGDKFIRMPAEAAEALGTSMTSCARALIERRMMVEKSGALSDYSPIIKEAAQ